MKSTPLIHTLGFVALTSAAALVGCTPAKTAPAHPAPVNPSLQAATQSDPVIANVGAVAITRSELQKPLMEAYGFTIFKYIVQRDMARLEAKNAGILVTAEDIAQERKNTLEQMFPEIRATSDDQIAVERERALDQFLAQPRQGEILRNRTEFEIVIETNCYLRKIAQKSLVGKISEDQVHEEFDVEYGSSVQVRHIMFNNPQEAGEALRRLAAGESFDKVARDLSRNKETGSQGGLLPPFTYNSKFVPEVFRNIAFKSLKEGEVSDLVQAEGAYHLVKLEKKIPAKAVKYEDVKDVVRANLESRMINEAIKALRAAMAERAVALMQVTDPILKAEFEKGLQARENLIRDRGKIREQMEKDRNAKAGTTTAPTTAPTAAPTAAPTVAPTIAPAAPAAAPAAGPAAPIKPSTVPSSQPRQK